MSGKRVDMARAREGRLKWRLRRMAAPQFAGPYRGQNKSGRLVRFAPNCKSGQTLVEFSLTAFLSAMLLLFVVETGRMLLVYAAVANAAREGVRYAVVHGSTRATGSGQNDASGPAGNPAQVLTVVNHFAGIAPLTTSLLVVSVTYPGSSNAPGQSVIVSVVYPYNPLITYFPSTLRLGSSCEGVIQF